MHSQFRPIRGTYFRLRFYFKNKITGKETALFFDKKDEGEANIAENLNTPQIWYFSQKVGSIFISIKQLSFKQIKVKIAKIIFVYILWPQLAISLPTFKIVEIPNANCLPIFDSQRRPNYLTLR